jgi:exopolysaccharide biosynthesis polyprenyl glycosylphosphotransferase
MFRVNGITPVFVVLFCGVSTTILVASRLVLRPLLARIRVRGHNCRHVVVVGTGPSARRLAEKFEAEPGLGYRLVGFVDDDWAEMGSFRKTGYPLVSTIAEFPRLLEETVVDEVVICLPMSTYYRQASRMVALAQEQGIVVRVRADFFDLQSMRHGPSCDSEEFVTLYPGAMDSPTVVAKRLVDIAFSGVLLLLALPVFILVPILIKLDSAGPVFFLQQRRGLNKRPFTMIKFRTMHQNAEQMLDSVKHLMEKAGPGFKIKDDPRITRVGKFLRRTSLDELPQLINVLKGEMSLVGPRPLFAWEFERIEEPWIKRRCSVRPGLTGLWQVSGRSDLPFDKRVELDLQYIDNWSLELDFQILAQTLPAVVLGRGAV